MKKHVLNILKTVTISAVAFAVIAVGTISSTIGTSAAEVVGTETSGVIYVQYSNLKPEDYWGVKAPEYTEVDSNGVGYFFGGWYTKSGDTYKPVETEEGLTGTVVAKFVPAQTMSVKCQNWAGTNASSDDVIIRVISATDSTNYKQFGFQVSKIVDGTETKFGDYLTDTVYKKFNYYESQEDTEPDTYVPSQLFGDAATRFTTCTVGKIPTEHHGTIICIKPFWDTLDGVRVYGLSKFAHVEDGYLGYVNVPVNLNILNGAQAAAGILSVSSDDNLEFLGLETGVEYGKVFDEMEFKLLSDGTIKCVGNTSDISDKTGIDIYVNLKFKKDSTSDAPIANTFYTFSVTGENFSSSGENLLAEQDVWDIIY